MVFELAKSVVHPAMKHIDNNLKTKMGSLFSKELACFHSLINQAADVKAKNLIFSIGV